MNLMSLMKAPLGTKGVLFTEYRGRHVYFVVESQRRKIRAFATNGINNEATLSYLPFEAEVETGELLFGFHDGDDGRQYRIFGIEGIRDYPEKPVTVLAYRMANAYEDGRVCMTPHDIMSPAKTFDQFWSGLFNMELHVDVAGLRCECRGEKAHSYSRCSWISPHCHTHLYPSQLVDSGWIMEEDAEALDGNRIYCTCCSDKIKCKCKCHCSCCLDSCNCPCACDRTEYYRRYFEEYNFKRTGGGSLPLNMLRRQLFNQNSFLVFRDDIFGVAQDYGNYWGVALEGDSESVNILFPQTKTRQVFKKSSLTWS